VTTTEMRPADTADEAATDEMTAAVELAEELVQRLEVGARQLVARIAEFSEDVWAEAQALRKSETQD
jgi:hypothetical protein